MLLLFSLYLIPDLNFIVPFLTILRTVGFFLSALDLYQKTFQKESFSPSHWGLFLSHQAARFSRDCTELVFSWQNKATRSLLGLPHSSEQKSCCSLILTLLCCFQVLLATWAGLCSLSPGKYIVSNKAGKKGKGKKGKGNERLAFLLTSE